VPGACRSVVTLGANEIKSEWHGALIRELVEVPQSGLQILEERGPTLEDTEKVDGFFASERAKEKRRVRAWARRVKGLKTRFTYLPCRSPFECQQLAFERDQ
jgi:hypothetical protein